MNNDNLRALSNDLEREVNSIVNNFKGKKSVLIIEIIKILDYAFVLGLTTGIISKKEKHYWFIFFKRYSQGIYDTLKYFYQKPNNELSLFSQVSDEFKEESIMILSKIADAGVVRRFIDVALHENALCNINDKEYTIEFDSIFTAVEYIEMASQGWLKNYLISEYGRTLDRSNIDHLLFDTEITKNDIYSDLLLQDFYHKRANIFASASIGYDYYSDDSMFGSLTFKEYKSIVTIIISFAEMHRDVYLSNLNAKKIKIDNTDSLTPIFSNAKLQQVISEKLDICHEKIEEAFDIIVLDDERLKSTPLPAGYASPILIKTDKWRVIMPVLACLTNPFMYLHRCLRYSFEKEYVIAAKDREERFKSDFYDLFDAPVVKVEKSILLGSKNKPITDIDAVLYSESEQILILVQLKWMEDWATDMRLRRNMKVEFEKKILKWLTAIDEYLLNNTIEDLGKRMSINNVSKRTKVYKLVLGKHFTHFEGKIRHSEDFYLNWARLIKLLVSSPQCTNSLRLFIDELKHINLVEEASQIKKELAASEIAFKFDSFKVKIKMG